MPLRGTRINKRDYIFAKSIKRMNERRRNEE